MAKLPNTLSSHSLDDVISTWFCQVLTSAAVKVIKPVLDTDTFEIFRKAEFCSGIEEAKIVVTGLYQGKYASILLTMKLINRTSYHAKVIIINRELGIDKTTSFHADVKDEPLAPFRHLYVADLLKSTYLVEDVPVINLRLA